MLDPARHIERTEENTPANEKVLGYFRQDGENDEARRDSFLWKAFLADSKEAFSELFLKYNPRLITIGGKLGFDRKSVEDCIQDLFLTLWTTRQRLSEVGSVKYYLVVSLRRSLLLQKEKKDKAAKLVSGILSDYPAIELPASWDEEWGRHQTERLLRTMDTLPQRQAEALKLRYMEGKPYPEIALIMSVDIGSVRKFVHKAVKGLKCSLRSSDGR